MLTCFLNFASAYWRSYNHYSDFYVQEFNPEPVIPIYTAWPDDVEKALKHVYHASVNKLKGKDLELLLAILPDNNGSLYGMLFKYVLFCLYVEVESVHRTYIILSVNLL